LELLSRAKKPIDGFETFDAVLEALAPKRTAAQRRRSRMAHGKWRQRKARAKREAKREVAEAVHRLTRPPSLDRPTYAATAELGHAAQRGEYVGRWWRCLELMGDGEWTLRALEGVWSLDTSTAHSVLRTLQKRALVRRSANPGATRYVVTGGLMAGRCTRPGKDRWLYQVTERAALVLSGAVEWRKPPGWNRLRAARAGALLHPVSRRETS